MFLYSKELEVVFLGTFIVTSDGSVVNVKLCHFPMGWACNNVVNFIEVL